MLSGKFTLLIKISAGSERVLWGCRFSWHKASCIISVENLHSHLVKVEIG